MRRPRVVGGLALAADEEIETLLMAQTAPDAIAEDQAPLAAPPSFDAGDLGLVEPGDQAAATAAINAARARRRTDV